MCSRAAWAHTCPPLPSPSSSTQSFYHFLLPFFVIPWLGMPSDVCPISGQMKGRAAETAGIFSNISECFKSEPELWKTRKSLKTASIFPQSQTNIQWRHSAPSFYLQEWKSMCKRKRMLKIMFNGFHGRLLSGCTITNSYIEGCYYRLMKNSKLPEKQDPGA